MTGHDIFSVHHLLFHLSQHAMMWNGAKAAPQGVADAPGNVAGLQHGTTHGHWLKG